jgi:hypothetical protein
MVFPDGSRSSPLTISGELGDIKAYADRNAKNYREKPRRMYEARATTELISLYASGALAGIVAGAGVDEYVLGSGPAPVGEVTSDTGSGPPARSVAPDGSTIPEHLREPEVDEDTRAALMARAEALDADVRADLLDVLRPLKVPNIKTHRFTAAHGVLLDRLLSEAMARHPSSGSGGGDDRDPAPGTRHQTPARSHPDPDTGEIPAWVYDDAPEARGDATDDPGRPFT